jgi:cobalt/nickel transport system permease protein
MGGARGSVDGLFVSGHSLVHRLAPECKVAAAVLFVLAVVSTPRESFWAYGVYAGIVVMLAAVARVPASHLLRRIAIEIPFVAFALLLPIFGRGERVHVVGVSLSTQGLWAGWNILVKGTLGVSIAGLLAATTPVSALLQGLARLRVPAVLVAICSFMIRYGDVISGEMQRMRIARESRGHDPRWIWQARAVAASAGALFIRSYERGERVYLAMASRGYNGTMPRLDERRTRPAEWTYALLVPTTAAMISAVAWLAR